MSRKQLSIRILIFRKHKTPALYVSPTTWVNLGKSPHPVLLGFCSLICQVIGVSQTGVPDGMPGGP